MSLFPGRLNELRKYGLESIGLTSNGIALHRKLPELIEHGLTHLNLRYNPYHVSIWHPWDADVLVYP